MVIEIGGGLGEKRPGGESSKERVLRSAQGCSGVPKLGAENCPLDLASLLIFELMRGGVKPNCRDSLMWQK